MEKLIVKMTVDNGATNDTEATVLLNNMLTANSLATEYAYQLSEYFKLKGIEAKAWIVKAKDEKAYNAFKMALSRWRKSNLSELERLAVTGGKGGGNTGKSNKRASKPVTATPESVKIAEEEIRKHSLQFVKSLSLIERVEIAVMLTTDKEVMACLKRLMTPKTDKAGKIQAVQARA